MPGLQSLRLKESRRSALRRFEIRVEENEYETVRALAKGKRMLKREAGRVIFEAGLRALAEGKLPEMVKVEVNVDRSLLERVSDSAKRSRVSLGSVLEIALERELEKMLEGPLRPVAQVTYPETTEEEAERARFKMKSLVDFVQEVKGQQIDLGLS